MALIKAVKGVLPRMGKNCYLAENATIAGDVEMGDDCSASAPENRRAAARRQGPASAPAAPHFGIWFNV